MASKRTDLDPEIRLGTDDLRARKLGREAFRALPRTPITLVLDGVHNPYNQGALLRLADGFLLEKLHFCGPPVQHWNRRFKKAARGTTGWVPHSAGEDALTVVEGYKAQGYQIVAAEQADGSVGPWQVEFKAPVCIVMGAEMDGVRDAILALADAIVEFPTLGMANSLNISMTAAMMVSAAFGQMGPPQV
jgi:23S rRNA (guanosine2251-2'-O)-methyltransferase